MAPPLPKEKVEILEEQFKKDNYIRGEEVMQQLVNATGLEAGQIRSWFARRRGVNIEKAEQKQQLILLNAKEAKIAELEAKIAELEAKLEAKYDEIKERWLEELPAHMDFSGDTNTSQDGP